MSTALEHVRPVSVPGRVSQGTAIEQSRAIAEVQAQVVVAQQMPRDVDRAVREMQRSCSRKALAEKAFYRFPRGGQQVSGESITLAKELARCWGNMDYGIAELRRDDNAGESEMMAFAWDLETNTRPRTTFIVPHVRDKKGGAERLTDVRDVYENNANMGARRMREMIFNVLPPWFIEDAKALCYATLGNDTSDGATLAERAATAVTRFARIGVRAEQLTRKLGAPQANWSPADLAHLAVIFTSIERGEATAEAEFGASVPAVSAADITGQPAAAKRAVRKPAEPKASPEGEGPTGAGPAASSDSTAAPASEATAPPADEPAPDSEEYTSALRIAQAQAGRVFGKGDEHRETRLAYAARILRLSAEHVQSFSDLTTDELKTVAATLGKCANVAELDKLLKTGEVHGDGE